MCPASVASPEMGNSDTPLIVGVVGWRWAKRQNPTVFVDRDEFLIVFVRPAMIFNRSPKHGNDGITITYNDTTLDSMDSRQAKWDSPLHIWGLSTEHTAMNMWHNGITESPLASGWLVQISVLGGRCNPVGAKKSELLFVVFLLYIFIYYKLYIYLYKQSISYISVTSLVDVYRKIQIFVWDSYLKPL